MRLKLLLPCLAVMLFAAAGMTIWSGCEVGSATESIYVDPSSVVLEKGQFQTFTASGGYDYTWSLNPEGAGKLNVRHGDTVVFEMLADPGSSSNGSGMVAINCTSFIPGTPLGSASTNSNSGGYSQTATAYAYYREASTNAASGGSTNSTSIEPLP